MKKIYIILTVLLLTGCGESLENQESQNFSSQKTGEINPETSQEIISENIITETVQVNNCITDLENLEIYVYMYHYIRDRDWDSSDAGFLNNAVVTENFDAQIQKFQELESSEKIKIIFLSDLEKYLETECFPHEKLVILTSDDGWDDNYINLYPIAKKYNTKFHLSIISNYTQQERYDNFITIDELSEINNDANFEIIGHTYSHLDLRYLNEYYLNRELCESKDTLESLTNTQINTIIYPAGKYNSTAINKSKECGYSFGFTTQGGINTFEDLKSNPFTLKRIRVGRHSTVASLTSYFED